MRKIVLAACVASVAVGAAVAATKPFPEKIPLPNGWGPEGIAIAPGGTFYVGSIQEGDVYRGSLKTGKGSVLVDVSKDERDAIGVEYANKRLYVAGGGTGHGYVYDARTGASIADYTLATPPGTFINDVVVVRGAAWFTDSNRPVLYKVTLATGAVQTVQLTGDYQHQDGFNLNGIDAAPNGKRLVVVQSGTGFLFTVDPATGATKRIAFGGDLTRGDGILLKGKRLYVVRNLANEIVELRLASDFASASEVRRIKSGLFRVPTTIDDFGNRIYAVNARFGTPVTPETDYDVVRVPTR